MKKQIVSIGIPINNGTNLYPMVKGEKTTISPIKTIDKDGVEIWNISFTSLDCTYIETVRHISSKGPFPPDIFAKRSDGDIYRAIIAHLDIGSGEAIKISDLEPYLKRLNGGDALIVDAKGYTEKWMDKCVGIIDVNEYNLGSPYFNNEAMRGIIDAGTSILAGNFPSFSNANTKEGFGVDMIAEFYKNQDNMILAPLINLGEISETEVVLQINPLVINNCCGLPCCPIVYQGDLGKHFINLMR